MDWMIGIWIKIQLWWFKLLGKTALEEKIIKTVKKVKNKKRGRKPKKK